MTTLCFAAADYEFANVSTECDSGVGRIVVSDYGQIQCVPVNSSQSMPLPLTHSQNASETTLYESISEGVLAAQISEATSSTDWSKPQDIYWNMRFIGDEEIGVMGIDYWIRSIKNYAWGLMILILEVVKLIFYIIEMLLTIYVIFTLIPETFFKLRDALVNSYIRRYAT
jgi:hypothetical protein